MTKEEWFSLKVGNYVCTDNKIARKVLRFRNGCITLKALRKTKYGCPTTIYSDSDKYKFIKVK